MANDINTPSALPASNTGKNALKAALLAGVLGAVAFGAIKTIEHNTATPKSTKDVVVQNIISESCSPAGPYLKDYRQTGLATEVASSILLKYPENTKLVCAFINESLTVAHAKNTSVDNTKLGFLVETLGMDLGEAHAMLGAQVEQEKANASVFHEFVNVGDTIPAYTGPRSMEPNL